MIDNVTLCLYYISIKATKTFDCLGITFLSNKDILISQDARIRKFFLLLVLY